MTNNPWHFTPSGKRRARAFSLPFEGTPGPLNAMTDVAGVQVGYTTLIDGEGLLRRGHGPVRTGVTAILPRPLEQMQVPVFAGLHNYNGNGELTGSHFIDDMGYFGAPITITNTHSCGLTRDASIAWMVERFPDFLADGFSLPVAAETYDGFLNDINGFHVQEQHVFAALDSASAGAIEEGSVGGGTGMKAFEFKAGSGTSSRQVNTGSGEYTVGVFVQANFGRREQLTILGQRVGLHLREPAMWRNTPDTAGGSIIVVIATDAPLLSLQLRRMAKRATLGLARTGCVGQHGSGDIFLAFSTANAQAFAADKTRLNHLESLPDTAIDPLFEAVVQATEEAILNALVANADMMGRDGNFVPALPHQVLEKISASGASKGLKV